MMQRGEAEQVIYYLLLKTFVVVSGPACFLVETDVNHFTGAFLKNLLSTPVPPIRPIYAEICRSQLL